MCTALKRLLIVTTLLLVLSNPAAAQQPKDPAVLLDLLLDDYQRYALPLPPKEARLALLEYPPLDVPSPAYRSKHYSVVFAIPATKRHVSRAIPLLSNRKIGLPARWKLRFESPVSDQYQSAATNNYWVDLAIADRLFVMATTAPELGETNELILLAIFCHKMGLERQALAFLSRTYTSRDPDYKPRSELGSMAWRYWIHAFENGCPGRTKIARQLQIIMSYNPVYDNQVNREMVAGLWLPLKQATLASDKVERLIDRLVTCEPRSYADLDTDDLSHISPEYLALWCLGFGVVPTLLKHIEDVRTTRFRVVRAGMGGQGNADNLQIFERVCDVVVDLIYGLTGLEMMSTKRKEVERWWREARKAGEESYLVRHALVIGNYAPERSTRLSPHILHLIAWKYSRRLVELYETMRDKYPLSSRTLIAELIPDYVLKAKLLLEEAKGQKWDSAMVALMKIQHPHAVCLLIERIERVPDSHLYGNDVETPATDVSQIARYADDSRVWGALEKLARRSDVRQRMEILECLFREGITGRKRRHATGFMAKFLDDTTECPPHKGYEFVPRNVGNLTAALIAGHLGVDAFPDKTWTDREWKLLHEKVREALKRKRLS